MVTIIFSMVGIMNASVFPVPVLALARQSAGGCFRMSGRVSAWTAVMNSYLNTEERALRDSEEMDRSANLALVIWPGVLLSPPAGAELEGAGL